MKTLRIGLACLLPVLALIVSSGCETESAATQVRISPETATVNAGDSVEFVAASGYTYSWSLSGDDTLGYLSNKNGQRVTYIATSAPLSNSVTRILTVQSVIANSGGGTDTNGTADTGLPAEWSAEATIVHLPVAPPRLSEPLSISPGSTTLTNLGASTTFTASGGNGSYAFVANPPGLGTLTRPAENKATYTASVPAASGVVKLTVTSGGESAQAVITLDLLF
jgi:plastocyanin